MSGHGGAECVDYDDDGEDEGGEAVFVRGLLYGLHEAGIVGVGDVRRDDEDDVSSRQSASGEPCRGAVSEFFCRLPYSAHRFGREGDVGSGVENHGDGAQ